MPGSLKDIRLFVAAYEERSFTNAARRENTTQSGVSQHIRALEDGLGVRLFTRDKGQVVPTPAGESYYNRCIDVLRAHASATSVAKGFAQGAEGSIVIGLMPTMTRCMLAPVLTAFTEAHPNVFVRVVEGYSAPLTREVRAGELDFAIVPAFEGLPGLKSQLFLRTPEMLVWARGYGSAETSPVDLKARGPLKLVLPSKSNTRRRLIETYCASNGIEPSFAHHYFRNVIRPPCTIKSACVSPNVGVAFPANASPTNASNAPRSTRDSAPVGHSTAGQGVSNGCNGSGKSARCRLVRRGAQGTRSLRSAAARARVRRERLTRLGGAARTARFATCRCGSA
mgnify:CR=1 FL=1